MNVDLPNLKFSNLFKYKFDIRKLNNNDCYIKNINLPFASDDIKLNYYKFKNKYNLIETENIFESYQVINYFKILNDCLNKINLSDNMKIDKTILANNKIDFNFDIRLNLSENILYSDIINYQISSNITYNNLYVLYKTICETSNDTITYYLKNSETYYLKKPDVTYIKYMFNKQLLINAVCEYLSITTNAVFSNLNDIEQFFTNYSDFDFNQLTTIEISNNYQISLLELIYVCDIIGHKLSIMYNLSDAFENTFCKSELSETQELQLSRFMNTFEHTLSHIYGAQHFSMDIYYIDSELKYIEAGDDLNNYTKITLTNKTGINNYLKNACIDNSKLYVFKIDFSTDKNGWSTLNPFIINNKNADKYQVISINDKYMDKYINKFNNSKVYTDDELFSILDEEEK